MLSRLLRGLEETEQVIVSVNRGVSARDLILQLLKNFPGENVLISTSPVQSSLLGCDEVVDLDDVLGWDNQNQSALDNKNLLNNILEQVKDKKVVVIDSLTTLYVLFSPTQVAHFLLKLKKVAKVIAVVHSDCVREGVISELDHLVTTRISVKKLEENQTNVYPKLCHIRHKKPGGKLITSSDVYYVDPEGKIKTQEFKEAEKKQQAADDDDEDETIDKLTTFNLGTNQTEKKARENLVLPFYKPEQQVDSAIEDRGEVKLPGNDGKIYYEPDSGDDWDEEDPDDDLDF